jgi:spermidine synthase
MADGDLKNSLCKTPRFTITLLSASALAYEILLMRLFSIIQWHHFAYMIISLALLGYGASGTFLAIKSSRLLSRYPRNFIGNILLFGISSLGLFLVAQQIPFNAQEVLWDGYQPWYLLLLYLILALPFFFAANAIGLSLMHYRNQIAQLYAADMLGAGVGSLAIILMLFIVFPDTCLRILSAAGIAAAALACWELQVRKQLKWLWLSLSLIPLLLPSVLTQLELSPYKGLRQILHISGSKIVEEYSSPLGLLSIVENSLVPLRHAPGLSLNATQEPPPQVGIFTDGEAMTVINQDTGEVNQLGYLDQLTSALPYHLNRPDEILVLGAGGGSEILQARYHGAKQIDAIEINPQIISLIREDYAQFSGEIYNNDMTRVHVAEARGFVTGTTHNFDLIQLVLLDAFNASSAGLYALSESYLYTVEAIQQYLQKLSPGGYLSISRWVKLPPRDSLKLFATAVEALKRNGNVDYKQQMILIRSWQTSTLLIKNGSFSQQEILKLQKFCKDRSFDIGYYPGMSADEANLHNRIKQPFFYQATQAMLSNQHDTYLDNYKFNIWPATDDRPYFFNFFKWSALPEIISLMGRGGLLLLEWGYLILIATLLQALIASLALIVFPLFFIRRELLPNIDPGIRPWRVFGYFFALGLAFLFIEIAFIQKFILFLHHPLYAASVVLTSFLLFAGLGSAYSRRYSRSGNHERGIKLAVFGIVLFSLVYLVIIGSIFSLILDWPNLLKAGVAVACIAPLAFCMGMPFPLGLSLLGDRAQYLIPWAWGVNGCASVLSAVLATLLAIHFGFTSVVVLALLLYIVSALIMITTKKLNMLNH